MQCARCQQENPAHARFCLGCGARLALTCAKCGTELPGGARFCLQCGQPVSPESAAQPRFTSPESYTPKHLAEKILTSKAALEGERKQVTVLFADLKGSMELLADSDPEEARELLDPVLERMMEAVHRYEGTVNQVMGDGIMALFGAPLAHEDHAVRACYAALRMQESVKRYAEELHRARGIPLQIRVGLNSGEVVVRSVGSDLRMDYTAVGQTTHLAARMEQMAMPGSILIPADTLRLAEDYVQVKALGPRTVKGLEASVEVYEIVGAGTVRSRLKAAAARGLTRFVGRDSEMDQLRQALARVGAGHGQVVAVIGEPGVGKSRLYWEFTHSHRTQGWLIVESGSVSYGKASAYLPVIDLLRAYFQIEARDDARKIREKVTGKLLSLDRALEPALPALLGLLDVPLEDSEWQRLEPSQRRQRTLDGVKRLLLRESQVQPLIVMFEDLHWIDTETQALLDSLVESLPTARLLLLVNYRPEYQHGWSGKSYYGQLRIDPLSPETADELLRALLGEDPTVEPLKRLLIERTEGNPFFLEESVRTLVETKVLAGERGAYRLAKAAQSLQIPATAQSILAARMDRLAPEDKRLLQAAAVLGKDVPFTLLQAIAEEPDEVLRRGLGNLQAAEFLYESRLFPDLEYTFRHALTQEVAYQSLLAARRQALHGAAGRALEALHADRLDQAYDRLAYHYSKTDNASKAVEYLTRFAEKAAGMYAHAEAVKALEEALVHAERLPIEERDRRSLELVVRRAESLHFLGNRREIVGLLLQHQERIERLGNPSLAGQYYFWLGWAHAWLGHRAEAAQNLGRSLQEATRSGDEALMGRVHRALALECTYSGRPMDEAVAHGRQAVSLLERTEDRFWLSQALFALSYSCFYSGDFDSALEAAARLDDFGRATGDRRARAESAMAGLSYATRGDWAKGVELCRRALELAPDPFETAFVLACLGKAYSEAGDVSRAVPTLEEGVQLADQVRSLQWRGWFRTLLGEAYFLSGQMEKARVVAGQALGVCTGVGFSWGIGWSHQVLGRVAQAQGALAEAERHLREALQTFVSVHARFEMGRTHLFLASLGHAQGDREAAASHLNEAQALFRALRVPKYVERTEQLAREFGASLSP
ncbi:MAG: adenylate/guanylate cyclase domain-containing protein [Candidatus Rokuibacteriota bacterium]